MASKKKQATPDMDIPTDTDGKEDHEIATSLEREAAVIRERIGPVTKQVFFVDFDVHSSAKSGDMDVAGRRRCIALKVMAKDGNDAALRVGMMLQALLDQAEAMDALPAETPAPRAAAAPASPAPTNEVTALYIACPVCGAYAGKSCLFAPQDNHPAGSVHHQRYIDAAVQDKAAANGQPPTTAPLDVPKASDIGFDF